MIRNFLLFCMVLMAFQGCKNQKQPIQFFVEGADTAKIKFQLEDSTSKKVVLYARNGTVSTDQLDSGFYTIYLDIDTNISHSSSTIAYINPKEAQQYHLSTVNYKERRYLKINATSKNTMLQDSIQGIMMRVRADTSEKQAVYEKQQLQTKDNKEFLRITDWLANYRGMMGEEIGRRIFALLKSNLSSPIILNEMKNDIKNYPKLMFKQDYEHNQYYLNHIDDRLKNSETYKNFAKAFKQVKVTDLNGYEIWLKGRETVSWLGKKVPEFKIEKFDQSTFDSQSLSDTPYIIAFSATWCGPCLKVQPQLLSLYHKYRAKGFHVVYFNLHDDRAVWEKQIKDKNLDWINVWTGKRLSASPISKLYDVKSIPRYLVINREGVAIYDSDHMDHDFKELETYILKAM